MKKIIRKKKEENRNDETPGYPFTRKKLYSSILNKYPDFHHFDIENRLEGRKIEKENRKTRIKRPKKEREKEIIERNRKIEKEKVNKQRQKISSRQSSSAP